jgi:hypothetical protein
VQAYAKSNVGGEEGADQLADAKKEIFALQRLVSEALMCYDKFCAAMRQTQLPFVMLSQLCEILYAVVEFQVNSGGIRFYAPCALRVIFT